MLNGLLARKMGMTQIFQDDGTVLPVTVTQAGPMTVVQKKTKDKDGCDHVQVGFEEIPERKLNKPAKPEMVNAPNTSITSNRRFQSSSIKNFIELQ